MLRSDTAGPAGVAAVLRGGWRRAVGVIEFAVGVDVTTEFRRAVSEVAEQDWQTLYRKLGSIVWTRVSSGLVNFVPNWIRHSRTALSIGS